MDHFQFSLRIGSNVPAIPRKAPGVSRYLVPKSADYMDGRRTGQQSSSYLEYRVDLFAHDKMRFVVRINASAPIGALLASYRQGRRGGLRAMGQVRSSARDGDGRRAVAARDIGRRTGDGDQGRSLDRHTETALPDDMTMACYLRQHPEEADGKWLSVREAEESQAKIEARHSAA